MAFAGCRAETEFWCQEPERLRSWVSEEMWKDQLLPKDDACSRYATHFYGVSSQDELRGMSWDFIIHNFPSEISMFHTCKTFNRFRYL